MTSTGPSAATADASSWRLRRRTYQVRTAVEAIPEVGVR